MGLIISNKATKKQKEVLTKLQYWGTGIYAIDKLTTTQAAKLIDELFEEERLANQGLDNNMLSD